MANFIEEFYYSNLDPQARSTKENKMVQKQNRDVSIKFNIIFLHNYHKSMFLNSTKLCIKKTQIYVFVLTLSIFLDIIVLKEVVYFNG